MPPPSQQICGGLQTAAPHGSGPPETTGPPLLVLLPVPEELPLLPLLVPPELPPELPPEPPPELLVLDPDEPLLPPDPPPPGELVVEPPHAIAMATPGPRNATIRILAVRMKQSSEF
jgi:hypothetical protein